jgi:hypothetical protein
LDRPPSRSPAPLIFLGIVCLLPLAALAWVFARPTPAGPSRADARSPKAPNASDGYQKRGPLDVGGFAAVLKNIEPWPEDATLEQVGEHWRDVGHRLMRPLDARLASGKLDARGAVNTLMLKAMLHNFEGEPDRAYALLEEVRSLVASDPELAREALYTIVFFQGVTALRRGETDNCVLCRGEGSCILPIAPAAYHTVPDGSRLAIGHFREYLERFPDDLEVRWLLNLAHMTLGEYPDGVDPRHLVTLGHYLNPEAALGPFRDVGHLAGINRLNAAGGAILDDLDGDGRLDFLVTSMDPTVNLAFFRNNGDGTFEDRTEAAGLLGQLGGLNGVQADFDNDGHLDLYIIRGAWLPRPIRPSLLRNRGDGTFEDVTGRMGLDRATNANTATWADYDNDGRLDLFVGGETHPNRLYRNLGDRFEEVAASAGVAEGAEPWCKGSTWIDFDDDDDPDLFLNHMTGDGTLYRNDGDGTFTDVSAASGITGPRVGFSCWTWDFDNDGRLDLWATSYDRTTADVIRGLEGERTERNAGKLWRNRGDGTFEDRTAEAGLDGVYGTMGSNFGDLDGDGWLDVYLGTGDPELTSLYPNRLFRNLDGRRFAEVTAAARVGHLQKGHGVAFGDYDRDGDLDLFVEMGGVTRGDRYHDVLFENPGSSQKSITVRLVGTTTNRAAIGARVEVVLPGEPGRSLHRLVATGSSFGANPLEQTIGLDGADRAVAVRVRWPTSHATQTVEDIPAGASIEIVEGEPGYRTLDRPPAPPR